jgi:hypothetical protein
VPSQPAPAEPPTPEAGDRLGPVEANPDVARNDFPLDLPEDSLPQPTSASTPTAPALQPETPATPDLPAESPITPNDSILGGSPVTADFASTQDISITGKDVEAGAEGASLSVVEQALESLADQVKRSTQPAIVNLVGSWESLTIDENGRELATRLSVDADGTATLSVQLGGKPVTIKGPLALEDGQLMFKSAERTLVVGNVITATKQQLVLERGGVRLVFARSDVNR